MGTIHTMLPIHSIAASENGEVAVIMNDSKVTWVRLYTARGKEIAYIVRSMEENGYPIAAAVSPDGKTLCLSSVQMSNTAVKSNVSFYDFGKMEAAAETIWWIFRILSMKSYLRSDISTIPPAWEFLTNA